MRLIPYLAGSLVLLLAAGCSSLPRFDDEPELSRPGTDLGHRLQLLRSEGERITGVPFRNGNQVSLLRDGAGTLPAIVAAIDAASARIDMETYVFDADDGLDIAGHLVDRASQGVEVRLIYDAWGSIETPGSLIERLRAAGVHVLEVNPLRPVSILSDEANHRDHRKLLVVDDRLAITGGVNISGVYLRSLTEPGTADDPAHSAWRDTDIRIEGPAVADYAGSFAASWAEHGGEPLPPHDAAAPRAKGELPVQVITNSPGHDDHDIYRSLLVAIASAQKSVHLTTGFFVPPLELRHALRRAARRGVDVRLLVPRNSTSPAAVEAGRGYYSDLLEDGVHIHEYPADRVLHAKTAVIDGAWSTVGSSNLDWRSVLLNEELSTVILGPAFGERLERMFDSDLARASEINAATWAQRPFGERFREWRARLFEYFL